jgi:hypothetical protein
MKPNAYLFSVFGPIWSCDVGHHLDVRGDEGDLNFNDGVLEPWEHLLSNYDEMRERMRSMYSDSTATRIVEYVYRYPDLNRLTEDQHITLARQTGLNMGLLLKKKTKLRSPKNVGATRTRELFLLMKKGRFSLGERAFRFGQFAIAKVSNLSIEA